MTIPPTTPTYLNSFVFDKYDLPLSVFLLLVYEYMGLPLIHSCGFFQNPENKTTCKNVLTFVPTNDSTMKNVLTFLVYTYIGTNNDTMKNVLTNMPTLDGKNVLIYVPTTDSSVKNVLIYVPTTDGSVKNVLTIYTHYSTIGIMRANTFAKLSTCR